MSIKKATASLLAIATTFTLAACGTTASDPNDEKHIEGMDKAMAMTLCRKNAERQLTSPDSAKWQNITGAEIEKSDDGGQWGIRTYVDSENAFGASKRAQVWCTVRPSDEDTAQVEAVLL